MEFEERPNEPFVFFAADKTDPGAYNLPLYLSFADPMHCAGLLLSPKMAKGFTFTIMDVNHTEGDRVIELNAPEELYDIACLLRDNERFVVESIRSRANDEIGAVVSTSRLHNIAGTYTGKDDPVALVRMPGHVPRYRRGPLALSDRPLRRGHDARKPSRPADAGQAELHRLVLRRSGDRDLRRPSASMRASSPKPVDAFDHPFWDWVRNNVAQKAAEIRKQGFSGPAMLPYTELEYGGVVEKMGQLDTRFIVRKEGHAAATNGRKKKAA